MTTPRKRWATIAVICAFLLAFGLWTARRAIHQSDDARHARAPLTPGTVGEESTRRVIWNEQSELTNRVLDYWANKPLADWQTQGKIKAPRALMARFL